MGRGVIALFGHSEAGGQSGFTGFRQESNFYYLTGHSEPDAALLIAPKSSGSPYREILFLPRSSARSENWLGPRMSVADAKGLGFDEVEDSGRIGPILRSLSRERGAIYALADSDIDQQQRLEEIDPGKRLRGMEPHLAELRSIKSPQEVALIREAADTTVAAFRAALRTIRPEVTEQSIAAEIVAVSFRRGCKRLAFPPIVAGGANATVLHYHRNASPLVRGQAVLIDAGAECNRYAADITRTLPVDGTFSTRQRQLYELVLAAQGAAIEAAMPGGRIGGPGRKSMESAANRVLREGAPDGVDPWLPHAVAHHVGLDVHDPEPPQKTLKEGMVLAIEPGIYLPAEDLGIRIEDIVEIRRDGPGILTSSLPRSADSLQALMGTREGC